MLRSHPTDGSAAAASPTPRNTGFVTSAPTPRTLASSLRVRSRAQVHHLPNRNWWERSPCAARLADLANVIDDWLRRFDAGDSSFLCGDWWTPSYKCGRGVLRALGRAEAAERFGGAACGVAHNATADSYTIRRPAEAALRAVAAKRACDYQEREAAAADTADLLRRFGRTAAGVDFLPARKAISSNFDLVLEDGPPVSVVAASAVT